MPEPKRPLNIAVVGAGFAGLASAALLARRGHRVTVMEKFDRPASLGAGILLQPTGLAALRALGIDDQVVPRGARIDHLWGVTPRSRPVVNVRYDQWRAGAFGLGLHRGVLFEALWRLAEGAGVRMATGCEVRELAPLRQAHDLVVVADGCRSTLRAQTGLACRDRAYPWGAVWAVLQDPQRRYGGTLWQWYRGAAQMLGIMPTGFAPGGDVPVVSLFWSLRADRHEAWSGRGLDAFKQEVLALHPEGEALLAQVTRLEQLTWARYRDVVMPAYHAGRCVVIGDAAHATSPQLGQGTNLALLDALALDECLAAAADPASGLAAYTRHRQGHLRFYGQASRWTTPLFQSDQRLLPWLRDRFMNLGYRLPWLGRLSHQTLAGSRAGWWTAQDLALPAVQDDGAI